MPRFGAALPPPLTSTLPRSFAADDSDLKKFIKAGTSALRKGGLYLAVLPDKAFSGSSFTKWRKEIMLDHTVKAIVELPSFTFEPCAY